MATHSVTLSLLSFPELSLMAVLVPIQYCEGMTAIQTDVFMNKQLKNWLSCSLHQVTAIDAQTGTQCESSQRINNCLQMLCIKCAQIQIKRGKRMIAGTVSWCHWDHSDIVKGNSNEGLMNVKMWNYPSVSKCLIQVPEVLFSFRIRSHQMILGQYLPLAADFLSYLMTWKNSFNQKGAQCSKKCPQMFLINPHAVRSSWIIHDQTHTVYKYTIHSICQFICSFHQSPSIHHVFYGEQSLLQCFVLGFKVVASQHYCQYFDVTSHIPKQPGISILPQTSKATENNKNGWI